MCFSAPVSFATSGFLAAAGIASMRRAEKNMRLLAAVPLLFAAQQFLEGIQWLAIRSGESSLLLAYTYLVFAFLLWPVYIPLTSYMNERDLKRKEFLKYFVIVGSAISLYLLYALFKYPLVVNSACCGIGYDIVYPFWGVTGIAYVAVVIGSLYFSTDKYFRLFALLMFVSAVFSWFVFYLYFTSTWCFFSAALSVLIGMYFYRDKINSESLQAFFSRYFPRASA